MLSTSEFATWATKVVLFLHNTSRVDDEPYPTLLHEKGGNGFPTVSYLDAEGGLLKQVGHVTPVAELETAWQGLQAWTALRAAVAAGKADAGKQLELFRMELAMGNRPFAEMVKRRQGVTIADNEETAVAQQLVNLQFTEILRGTPRDQQHVGGEKFVAMFREQRIPATTTETSYWQYMFAFATHKNDVALFEELLAHLKKAKAGDQRLQRYLGQLEDQLTKMKAGKGGG